MNYIGSKYRLLPFLTTYIQQTAGDLSQKTMADLFAGTGAVVQQFKGLVKYLIANDIETYSYVLGRGLLANDPPSARLEGFIAQLNELMPIEGLIYTHYCMGSGSGRQYFSDANGQKIDAVRQQIEEWLQQGKITADEYFFLLGALIASADKVANTASVYGAFLKKLKKTAQKELLVRRLPWDKGQAQTAVFQQDANVLVRQLQGDILYLDPPYNARHYGANYHLLNTIACYDDFEPQGKTGLRPYHKSPFCYKKQAPEALEDLLKQADFEFIFLSYNNEGIVPLPAIQRLCKGLGVYRVEATTYQRFRADKADKRVHKAQNTTEYLHIIQKKG